MTMESRARAVVSAPLGYPPHGKRSTRRPPTRFGRKPLVTCLALGSPGQPARTRCRQPYSGRGTAQNFSELIHGMYTIGGMITGFPGFGLVLQNNAGDDLAVCTDCASTFTTALSNGAAYAVTVKTQPSAPPQNCVFVGNGSGTGDGANVTDVAVVCYGRFAWTTPSRHTRSTRRRARSPRSGRPSLQVRRPTP